MSGTAGTQFPLVIMHLISGDASGGDAYTMTRGGVVVDARTAASAAGGTVQVSGPLGAITDAMATAANTPSRAATISVTNGTLVAGNALTFTASTANERGRITVFLLPPVAGSTTIT